MLSLWANWLVTKFRLNSLKRYLWPVLYYRQANLLPCFWGGVDSSGVFLHLVLQGPHLVLDGLQAGLDGMQRPAGRTHIQTSLTLPFPMNRVSTDTKPQFGLLNIKECNHGPIHKGANHTLNAVSDRDSNPFLIWKPDLPFVNTKLFQIRLFKCATTKKGVLDHHQPRKPVSKDLWMQSSFRTWSVRVYFGNARWSHAWVKGSISAQ